MPIFRHVDRPHHPKKKNGKPWTGAHVGFSRWRVVSATGEPPLVRYQRLSIRYNLSHRPHLKAVFRKPKTQNTLARGRRWTWRHNSTLGLAKLPQRARWGVVLLVCGAASLSAVSRQRRGVICKGQNVHYFLMDIWTLAGESTRLSRQVRTTRPATTTYRTRHVAGTVRKSDKKNLSKETPLGKRPFGTKGKYV